MREDIFINTERETALNTHRLQRVVSHNTILSANEQIDFTSFYGVPRKLEIKKR